MVSPHYGDLFCLFHYSDDQQFFVVQISVAFGMPMGLA